MTVAEPPDDIECKHLHCRRPIRLRFANYGQNVDWVHTLTGKEECED